LYMVPNKCLQCLGHEDLPEQPPGRLHVTSFSLSKGTGTNSLQSMFSAHTLPKGVISWFFCSALHRVFPFTSSPIVLLQLSFCLRVQLEGKPKHTHSQGEQGQPLRKHWTGALTTQSHGSISGPPLTGNSEALQGECLVSPCAKMWTVPKWGPWYVSLSAGC
jgi:hypothetical protein